METTTHQARITGPVPYSHGNGQTIPIGPCLVERMSGQSIDVIWGSEGQRSVLLTPEQVEAAREEGRLVLLD